MNLIGTLIALLAERLLGRVPWLGEPLLVSGYVRRLHAWISLPSLWTGPWTPFALLVPPVALTLWVQRLITFPLLHLVFASAVLLLCLGPRDLADDVKRLLRARADGDGLAMIRLTRRLKLAPEPAMAQRQLVGALFIQSHERLFAVLLWFFFCGPVGAVLYRVVSRLPGLLHEVQPDSPAEDWASRLHAVLAWPTARITAVIVGLGGSLDEAMHAWGGVGALQLDWRRRTWEIVARVGGGALTVEEANGDAVPASLEECLKEVVAMQTRALLILLAALALFTVGGWVV